MTNPQAVVKKKVFDLVGAFVTDQIMEDGRWVPVRAGRKMRLGSFDDYRKAQSVGNTMMEEARAHASLAAGYANGKKIKDVKNDPGLVVFTVPNCAAPVSGHRDFAMDRFAEHQSEAYAGRTTTRDRLVSVNVVVNDILTRTGWSAIVQTSIANAKKRSTPTDKIEKEPTNG